MEDDVAALRREFLGKRVERRQAETLIGETEAQEAVAAGRRGQQALDDWYGSRLFREEAGAGSSGWVEHLSQAPAASESAARRSEGARDEA